MDKPDEDMIDFKPFFDMVVGVLFILLILVAAQMFFAQWTPETAPKQTEQSRRVILAQEADLFLDDFATRLRAADFNPSVDRINYSVSIPAHHLMALAGQKAPIFTIDRGAATRYARALEESMSCISSALERAKNCPNFSVVRLLLAEPQLIIEQQHSGMTPEPAARIAALDLSAALFSSTPKLLQVLSPTGAPALRLNFDVLTTTRQEALSHTSLNDGRFDMRFSFADFPKPN